MVSDGGFVFLGTVPRYERHDGAVHLSPTKGLIRYVSRLAFLAQRSAEAYLLRTDS